MERISGYILVWSLVFLSFVSCQENANVAFDQYQQTAGSWDKTDVKTFIYEAKDTVSAHNLYMNLRVNKSYPYSNLYVIFKMHQPNADVTIDTLQFKMADQDGVLLGNGFSDLKENKLELKENVFFQEKGSYKFTLEQIVRELGEVERLESLEGVSEVGLRIEKQE